jgi:hypothetical protein
MQRMQELDLALLSLCDLPEYLPFEDVEAMSGLDDLVGRDLSADRRPFSGSALDREYSRQLLDPLLH